MKIKKMLHPVLFYTGVSGILILWLLCMVPAKIFDFFYMFYGDLFGKENGMLL